MDNRCELRDSKVVGYFRRDSEWLEQEIVR